MRKEQRDKIKEKIKEIERYESAIELLTNYDVKFGFWVWSGHNGNTKRPLQVEFPADNITEKDMKEMIQTKLNKLSRELNKLTKGTEDDN